MPAILNDAFLPMNDKLPRTTTALLWFTYYRCLRNHLKCHDLQIEMNNRFLHILQQSVKVSLIVVSVEQLIYLFVDRWWPLPIILPITRRDTLTLVYVTHGRQNCFQKDDAKEAHWLFLTQTHWHKDAQTHTLPSNDFSNDVRLNCETSLKCETSTLPSNDSLNCETSLMHSHKTQALLPDNVILWHISYSPIVKLPICCDTSYCSGSSSGSSIGSMMLWQVL